MDELPPDVAWVENVIGLPAWGQAVVAILLLAGALTAVIVEYRAVKILLDELRR